MNKILLTGSTGFIGNNLLSYFLKQHIQSRVLVRDITRASVLSKDIEFFSGDLTDSESLNGACDGIDTVFHLAGLAHTSDEKNASFAKRHHAVNFVGTQNILNEATRSNVKKFIYFSSVKAVGASNNCIDETWDALPESPYGNAKRQAERLILSAKNNGMHVCILRPALVYGPGWKGNLASMLRAIDHGIFPPPPENNNKRSMVSVYDLCQAAMMAAQCPEANGKTYFVTDGIDYSTRQLYILMCQALGKSVPKWHIPLSVFKGLAAIGDAGEKLLKQRLPLNSDALSKLFSSAQYSSQRIKTELGFKSEYDLEKVLPEIVRAYKENH